MKSSEVKEPNPKDAAGSARIDFSLLDPIALAEIVLVMEEGGSKYGYFNYAASPVKSRVYVSAALRHLFKWLMGEERTKEGGHHLGAVMACCMILLSAQSRGTLIDNRPPSHKDGSMKLDEYEARVKMVRELFKGFSPRHYTIEDKLHEQGTGEPIHPKGAQEAG